ncbi:cadherin-related family member 5 isoform X2 [Platichthys flesus]|uniref:cadherin-related family member 5 isoform X2 n=1 Tax=Platichthys flesus TaxID=8260 RepID=UPI002DBA6883|nr:cadherin-related family member 5 isoform X2 [Platichthys flesus]
MDAVQPHLTVRTSFILILLSLLQMSSGSICSGPGSVQFKENNKVDDLVATITVQQGVTLELMPPSNLQFKLRGNELLAAEVFDYETGESPIALITCTETATGATLTHRIVVILENVNDNPPVFDQSLYQVSVSEMSPVGTTVGNFAATDRDQLSQLFYTLTPESQNSFELKSPTTPDLLIKSPLDYDTVKNVNLVLYAQDTPLTTTDNRTSFNATATITVTILDADNRPPWFQPCNKTVIGSTVTICQSQGYTGRVLINEQENGTLTLKPGPLYAIDGDTGINEEMTYKFISGNDGNLFEINANTGNISMLKPAKVEGTINLIVMAAQKRNSNQFATTLVTISVQVKSLHPPKFQKPLYEGVVSSMGSMAMDGDMPLFIHATDEDYSEVTNPHIVYTISGSSDFTIINGYLFMTKDLPASTLTLQVVATDGSNDQSDTAQLIVQVVSVIIASGSYDQEDMIALGVTLGVLLLVCLVVIGVLSHRMRKGKADWKKIYEVSLFHSSLGQSSGGQKKGVEYTNEAFQNDEDGGSTGSSGPEGGVSMEAIVKSSLPLHALLPDDTKEEGLDTAENEKEVKPILTKERRMEEGYKAVWFKEDIDPNAKEEVVIIPDTREDDSDEEDEPVNKTPKVNFDDTDLDSGLGVKMGDQPEDSDDDEEITSDL